MSVRNRQLGPKIEGITGIVAHASIASQVAAMGVLVWAGWILRRSADLLRTRA